MEQVQMILVLTQTKIIMKMAANLAVKTFKIVIRSQKFYHLMKSQDF